MNAHTILQANPSGNQAPFWVDYKPTPDEAAAATRYEVFTEAVTVLHQARATRDQDDRRVAGTVLIHEAQQRFELTLSDGSTTDDLAALRAAVEAIKAGSYNAFDFDTVTRVLGISTPAHPSAVLAYTPRRQPNGYLLACHDALCERYGRYHVEDELDPQHTSHTMPGADAARRIRVYRFGSTPWVVDIDLSADLIPTEAVAVGAALAEAGDRARRANATIPGHADATLASDVHDVARAVWAAIDAEGRTLEEVATEVELTSSRLRSLLGSKAHKITLPQLGQLARALNRELSTFFTPGSN